jgi:hypothetical protein
MHGQLFICFLHRIILVEDVLQFFNHLELEPSCIVFFGIEAVFDLASPGNGIVLYIPLSLLGKFIAE